MPPSNDRTFASSSLDRAGPLPLWAQLEADLRARIHAAEFVDGVFPTDLELTEHYGVSRHTVREAIRHLAADGLVSRQRGRGSTVVTPEFEQPLGRLYSIFSTVEQSGVEQQSEVLEFRRVEHNEAAHRLGLVDGAPVVLLARLRLAAGRPLAVDRIWLPVDIGDQLADVAWDRTSLYDELRRVGVGAPTSGWEQLSPVVPDDTDRAALDMAVGDAAFRLHRLGVVEGRPIEWRVTVLRGDRFRFRADWTAGHEGAWQPEGV